MDEIAKNTDVASGSKVTIKLTVVPKNEADVQSANEIKGKAGNGKKVEFLDMSLLQQIDNGTPTDIGGENTKLLTIVIPFDFTNVDVSSVMIIRKHGNGAATTLTTTANGDGEYFAVDTQAGTITIYAKKFSDYALAYEEEQTDPMPWRPHRPFGPWMPVDPIVPGPVTPVTPDEPTTPDEPEFVNPFVDVEEGEYYYEAVLWAAKTGITDGMDATHFAPEIGTTRGHMVTFLWRAAGCPESALTACPFTDIDENEYYYKAVLWAFEKGITDGTSATTFSPDRNVTRGQAVTFLARFNGVKDDAEGYSHNFVDVKATEYYNNAVAWAFENKITDGTSETTFSPGRDCLRCEIVTYLYRNFVKAE